MGDTTLSEQIEDLRKAGVTVRRAPVLKGDVRRTVAQDGGQYWLKKWAINAVANAPLVKRGVGVRFLAESCNGLPAFIVGCGPSLDADIATLKQAQGNSIIIATDASFRALMAKGIRPDIVISYDCKPEQHKLWDSVPPHDVPALFDTCQHPSSVASWGGPVLFYNHWHQSDEFSHEILPAIFPGLGQIPSGATVGNMALFLSKLLGCTIAIAVGIDFCYAKTDKGWRYRAKDYKWVNAEADHAEGWQPTEQKEIYDNDVRVQRSFMRSMGGVEYRTDPELECYYETFNQLRTQFKIDAVNCAAGGMLAQSCETIPLAAAIERYCKKETQAGRTVLPHLRHIIPDPRAHVE